MGFEANAFVVLVFRQSLLVTMSLITKEMAAQNGKITGDFKQNDDRRLLERAGSTQLTKSKDSYSNNGDELSRDYNAPPSSYSVPKQHGGLDRSANGLADFFSPEVFQIVLHNPTTAHRLLKFSQARMCGENMEFLEKVGVAAHPHVYLAHSGRFS